MCHESSLRGYFFQYPENKTARRSKVAGDIYSRNKSDGATALPLSSKTTLDFSYYANKRFAFDFIIYGIIVALIIASFVGCLFPRSSVGLARQIHDERNDLRASPNLR